MGILEWLILLVLWVFAVLNFDFNPGITPTTDTGQRIAESFQEFKNKAKSCTDNFWEKTPEERKLDCFGR